MKKLVAFIATFALFVIAACSGPSSGGPPEVTATGSAAISVQGAVTLTSLSYSISNGGPTLAGTVPVGNLVSFQIGNIPVGSGYILTLTGTDSAGFSCTGASSPCTVSDYAVTMINVPIVCLTDGSIVQSNPNAGAIQGTATITVDGSANNIDCVSLAGLTANPSDIAPGTSGTITSTETGGSAPIVWSTLVETTYTGLPYTGSFGTLPTFTCPTAATWTGTVLVTATVTEPAGCAPDAAGTQATVMITCE
jgi:hypothetical protein